MAKTRMTATAFALALLSRRATQPAFHSSSGYPQEFFARATPTQLSRLFLNRGLAHGFQVGRQTPDLLAVQRRMKSFSAEVLPGSPDQPFPLLQ